MSTSVKVDNTPIELKLTSSTDEDTENPTQTEKGYNHVENKSSTISFGEFLCYELILDIVLFC